MGLQNIRKAKGLSQSQLANKSNVNLRTLQQYEQDTKNINGARLNTLVDLAIVLECNISDMLTDEELKSKCQKVSL